METFDDLLPGKLFNADAVRDQPIVLTIKGFERGTLKGKNGGEEAAAFIEFEDSPRRMVVKPSIVDNLKEIFGKGAREAAIGQRVELYCDPNVRDAAQKKVGGLRLRKPTTTEKGAAPF